MRRQHACAVRQVPAASLALFNTLSIILLIPIYDRGLVPLLRRFGTKLSLLSRIGEAERFVACCAPAQHVSHVRGCVCNLVS